MQLFSRNKAIVALSLGALALGACGDDVTVPVAPAAPITLSITPPSANMNVGESVNFAVQISGGATAPTLASCTTSSATVATAAVSGSSCRVTAIAAGNATVTATASTGQSAAASVSVAAPAAAISGLQVSPNAASVAVNQTVTIVPTVNKGAAAVAVAYTYATSTASVATVTAAGVVTAVAPGVATITVTATGTGTGFTSTTLTSAAAITVTALPSGMTSLNVTPTTLSLAAGGTAQLVARAQQPTGAATASITYGTTAPAVATVGTTTGLVTAVGPGTAVITVTATSAANASFAAATLSGTVTVTVAPAAQVIINSLTKSGATVDIANVNGQFEVNLQLEPNGQIVSSVQTFVCANGVATAECVAGAPAAQQTFGSAGAQAGMIQLYVNSAEFAEPNFTTGDDANTLYKNGLKTIVATVTTAGASPTASNNLSSINFNNADGWTISWQLPLNKATSAAGITYYGGPSTPDAMLPGSQSGEGSFTMVPVLYTKDRTINSMTASANGASQGNLNCSPSAGIQATARPFRFTYGTRTAHSTTAPNNNFSCTSFSNSTGWAPEVSASVDNRSIAGPTMTWGNAPTSGQSVFRPINGGTGYLSSLAYRPAQIVAPHDYAGPVIARFEVKGGGAASIDSGWVNGTYAFNSNYRQPNRTADSSRYLATDVGVGLLPTASRNTVFEVCPVPETISTTAATSCSSPVASGGLSATISSIGLTESANLTNQAYFATARETDRLGNRRTTNPFSYTTSTGSVIKVTTVTTDTLTSRVTFGVDLAEPRLVDIPNTGADAIANFARTDRDSIYASGTPKFAVRFTDSRSGFPTCTNTVCQNQNNQRAGTFQITRRMRPTLDSYTNDALVESMNNWESDATSAVISKSRSIDAGLFSNDNTIREFAVNYFGEAARAVQTTSGPENEGVYQPGYYTFTGTLTDRAGNSTTIPARSIAMDQGTPVLASVSARQLSSGSPAVVDVSGSDDLEVVAGELSVTYGLGSVTFRRTPAMTATARLGFWHNPFAAVTDNKLTTIVGAGTALGATPLQTPIALLGQITQVNGANAPLAPAAIVGTGKPTAISARLFDIRATVTRSSTVASTQFADSGASNRVSTVISASQLANNTKNWTETAAVGYASPVGIQSWAMHDPVNAGSSVEFRARTSSSTTNAPFTRVHVLRRNASVPSEWEYVGDASYVNVLDQGTSRVYRWSFTGGASAQGQYNVAAIADQDVLIAVGADNAGIGLATQATAMGVAPLPAVFTTETVQLSAALGASYRNTDAAFTRTLSPSANPQSANLSYTCSSSNSTFMTAQMGQNGVCTLTPTGTVSAVAGVKVALTFTILGLPQNSETYRAATITRTDTVVRLPDLAPVNAITSASITGSIPATLTPGQTFQLTAVPVLASGYAGSPTYNWTAAPVAGLSLTAGQGSATATYTWSATAASFSGPVTINATVAAADAAGFIGNSTTPSSGPTTVAGYTDQDAGFGGALTPANSIINANSTLNLTMTPAGSSNPANTQLSSCDSSKPAAATVSPAGVVTAGAALTGPDSTVITCQVSRTQNQFGGSNYAARGPVSTNSVRVTVVVPIPAISAVSVGGSIPASLNPGDAFTLTATPTQPAGAGAATYTWDAAPTGFTATGLSTASATYTWVGSQSRSAAVLTLGVSATAATSTGFTTATVTNSANNTTTGYWNTDTPWSLGITPSNATIDPTGGVTTTGVMAFTALFNSNPANTSYSCSTASSRISVTNAATGAYVANTNGEGFTSPSAETINCNMSRTLNSFGGSEYAARSTGATAMTTVTVLPRSIQSVAFTGSGSITTATGNSVTVAAANFLTSSTAVTPGTLTYSIPAPTGGSWIGGAGDPTVTINGTTGALTVNTAGATAGSYPITVNLAGAGVAGSSYGNNKTTATILTIVVTP